jgi:hypothetical protein
VNKQTVPAREDAGKLEKEARLVVKELWAKISAREKFVVYGAAAVIVGWIVGQFIATYNPCAGLNLGAYGNLCSSASFSYFSAGNAGMFALLGLIAGIGAAVIVYLKVAPNMNITWPMPVAQVLLGVSAVALACGVLVVLMQVSYGLGNAPITMWIADLIFVGGGAVMAWFSYQEFLAAKTPAA